MARKLIVEVVGDSKSYERSLKRSAAATNQFGQAMGTTSPKVGKLQGVMSTAGVSAVALSGAAAGLAVAVGAKAVSAASDLNEQLNRTNVVFESSSDAIKAWSDTTAESLGISQRQALEAAGGFGQMLQTAGLTADASADMSKALVQLAADMASFNNIDPSEALLKLKSGLAGEAEPLRTVGVLLSETRVKQEAYRLGLARTGATLTEQQKVQARYSLILKDTAKQQGDFARTSDSLANQTRILNAEMENLQANIGQVLLPAVTLGVRGLNDMIGVSRTLAGVLGEVAGAARDVAKDIKAIPQGRTPLAPQDAAQTRSNLFGISGAIADIEGNLRRLPNFFHTAFDPAGTEAQKASTEIEKIFQAAAADNSLAKLIGDLQRYTDALKDGTPEQQRAAVSVQLLVDHLSRLGGVTGSAVPTTQQFNAILAALGITSDNVALSAARVAGGFEQVRGVFDATTTSAEATAAALDRLAARATSQSLLLEAHGAGAQERLAAAKEELRVAQQQEAAARKLQGPGRATEIKKALQAETAARAKIRSIQGEIDADARSAASADQAAAKAAQDKADALKKQAQAQHEAAVAAVKSKQFQAIGLTGEGLKPTPGGGSLLQRALSIEDQFKDAGKKVPAQLRKIINFLKTHLKSAKKEVRDAILDMLNGWSDAFEGKGPGAPKGPLTSTHGLATNQIIKNLGLTVEQAEEIQRRLAKATTGGTVKRATGGGISTVRPAGESGRIVVESHTTINLDGQKIANVVTRNQQKAKRRNPKQKRGPHRTGGV